MKHKKQKVGNVPILRFPGFNQPWKKKRIIDIAPLQRGFDLPVGQITHGKYPVVFSNGIAKHHKEFKVIGPGVVTGRSGTIGNVSFVESNFWPHNTTLWVTDFKGNNPKFIYHFYIQYDLSRFGTGSGVPTLNRNDIHGQEVYFPELSEQIKIASLLSVIDERIAIQIKLISNLIGSKSAVAKKIFSQQFKFRGVNAQNFPNWDECKLGDVLDYEQPTNYLVSSTEYDDKYTIPVVTAGKSFILGFTNETNGVYKKEDLPVIIFDDFTTATQFVDFQFKTKSTAMKILKAKANFNIKYIYEAMQMIRYEIGGHGRHWISIFSELTIPMPCIAEQNKIAELLSSIDKKIEIEKNTLTQLEKQKKYLLQNLFV